MQQKAKKNSFFKGDVYRANWLIDSVKAGQLLDKQQYFSHSDQSSSKRLSFTSEKVAYSITEAIKVFDIGMTNSTSAAGATFWKEIKK